MRAAMTLAMNQSEAGSLAWHFWPQKYWIHPLNMMIFHSWETHGVWDVPNFLKAPSIFFGNLPWHHTKWLCKVAPTLSWTLGCFKMGQCIPSHGRSSFSAFHLPFRGSHVIWWSSIPLYMNTIWILYDVLLAMSYTSHTSYTSYDAISLIFLLQFISNLVFLVKIYTAFGKITRHYRYVRF